MNGLFFNFITLAITRLQSIAAGNDINFPTGTSGAFNAQQFNSGFDIS